MSTPEYLSVKPMLVPLITENRDAIRVGGYQANITREIYVDDVDEFYSLMKDMDGKNSYEYLERKYSLEPDELQDIIGALTVNGVLYKNDNSDFDFTKEEIEYYSRNLNFFAWIDVDGKYINYWHVQDILKKSKILVLGSGGTGSHCTEALARLGFGNITIVDFDKVELSNLNRQNFEYSDVGKLKTDALIRRIEKINPFTHIQSYTKKIQTADDIEIAGSDYDLVVGCIDKPKNNTELLDEYSKKFNIPWILGGYASTIINHAIFGRNEVKFSEFLKLSREDDFVARSVDNNSDWKWDNAVISPVAATSGNISALYALYYVTGLKALEFGKIQNIDLYNVQDLKDFSYIMGIGEE